MVNNSKNGSSTKTGLLFESRTDLIKSLSSLNWIKLTRINIGKEIYKIVNIQTNKDLGYVFKKNDLYKFIDYLNLNCNKKNLSKKIFPDSCIYILKNNILNIIEVKFQKVEGSVDEKLQTCGYKLWIYNKLFANTNITVKYIYLLNDWFKNAKYKDTLEYIKIMNCFYFFNEIPLDFLEIVKDEKS